MDPRNPSSFNHRTERLFTGRVYHFVDQIPPNYEPTQHPTLLCVHGFPDLWYGWRYQIGPWVRRGYRVVVPDMLGYGGTDKPTDPAEYSTKKLCADLAALLDLLGIDKAVLIGHDWGSFTVGRFALWHPHRLSALIMLSVAYVPPAPTYLPIEEIARIAPNLAYQVYFADPSSTEDIQASLPKFLANVFSPPSSVDNFTSAGTLKNYLSDSAPTPDIDSLLTEEEFAFYCNELSKGMNGPLNYYRTGKVRYEEELAARLPSNLSSTLPALLIWGSVDVTATPSSISKSHRFINRLQDISLEGKGHWLMVHAKDEVTNIIGEWLRGLTSPPNYEGKL